MKRVTLLIAVLICLAGGSVFAAPGGVWKSAGGEVPYSFYVQTYAGGSMLVMMTADAGSYYVFMDSEYIDYFHANKDLAGNDNALTISFHDDDTAVAVLRLSGSKESELFDLIRTSVAPALEEDPGIEEPGEEEPGEEEPGEEEPGEEEPGGTPAGNPPTGSLVTPYSGTTVIGLTTVSGYVHDDVGVDRVTLRVGAGPELTTMLNAGTGVYLYMWDSTTAAKGPVTLVAKAYDTQGLSAVIGTQEVTVNNTVGPVMNQVQTISPANGASGLTLPISMTWGPVDDMVSYRIQVADNVSFTSPLLVDQDVSGTSFSFNQQSSGTVYWRVRGNYSSNHFAPWSYTQSFSVYGGGQ